MQILSRAIVLAVALCPLAAADAAVNTLQDSAVNWPGYPTATPNTDPFGVPRFSASDSGSITVINGHLQSLTVTYTNTFSTSMNSLWKYLKPGDVFIDSDSNGAWNYVLRTPFFNDGNYYQSGSGPLYNNSLSWQVLDVSATDLHYDDASDAASYQMGNATQTSTGQSWSGIAQTRVGHPWSVTNEFVGSSGIVTLGSITTSDPWDNLTTPVDSSGAIAWDLSSLSSLLPLSNNFVISFTINCSNDVLYDQVTNTAQGAAPLPEPLSLTCWLLGLAAFGFQGSLRRLRQV